MLLLPAVAAAQTYPPPFPRKDAVQLIENDRVEIWDVTWPKGQPTAMHEHPYDQISITLTPGTIKVTRPDGNSSVGQSKLPSATFVRKGTVHAEEGMSDIPQHKIMVELKPSTSTAAIPAAGPPDAFPREGAVKLLDNDRAVVWDFTWKPGQPTPRHLDYLDSVTIFLEGGTLRSVASQTSEAVRKAGDVVYSPAGTEAHTEEAVSGSPRAIVVELK